MSCTYLVLYEFELTTGSKILQKLGPNQKKIYAQNETCLKQVSLNQ